MTMTGTGIKTRFALLAITAISFAVVSAQEPSETPPQGEQPRPSGVTERVQVRLVQVPILARDRQGRPVVDLTAEELTVKSGGDRKRVAFLDSMRPAAVDAMPLPEVRLSIDAPGGRARREGEPD